VIAITVSRDFLAIAQASIY